MSDLWVAADPAEASTLGQARDPAHGRLSLSLSGEGLTIAEIIGVVPLLGRLDPNCEMEVLYQQMDAQRMALITQVPPDWVVALASLEETRRPAIAAKWRESVD